MLFRDKAEELLARVDVKINGERPWDIRVHDNRFFGRVFRDGSVGLGESYVEGFWDCDAIDEFFARVYSLEAEVGKGLLHYWFNLRNFIMNVQTKTGARKVIDLHYNLGNELFEPMLGPTMAYTCSYWPDPAMTLTQAQEAKFDLICRKLHLGPMQLVLDIGCGWGGFARFAADNYGARVVGITLSEAQAEFARGLCKGRSITINLCDYRDLKLSDYYDAVTSVGMIEHVGRKNYRALMEVAHRVLRPGGMFLLHSIGNGTSQNTVDAFIERYVFPHGLIPSARQIAAAFDGLFVMQDVQNIGRYYDPTLVAWCRNFEAAWPQIRAHDPGKYTERFYRLWRYYLLFSAGVFRAGGLQLWQWVLTKGPLPGVYKAAR